MTIRNSHSCSPLENKVEPIADDSYPDESDSHCFLQLEPDREEEEESRSEISYCWDEEKPVLKVHEILLKVAGSLDSCTVHKIHSATSAETIFSHFGSSWFPQQLLGLFNIQALWSLIFNPLSCPKNIDRSCRMKQGIFVCKSQYLLFQGAHLPYMLGSAWNAIAFSHRILNGG